MKPSFSPIACITTLLLAATAPLAFVSSARADDKPPDLARHVFLTDITMSEDKGAQAQLYDRYHNKKTRLRLAKDADTFEVQNAEGTVILTGRAVHLSEREMIFRSRDKYYALGIGQSLADALREPLSAERVKELKLPLSKDREAEIQELKAEIKALNQRLREMERRLSELEKRK